MRSDIMNIRKTVDAPDLVKSVLSFRPFLQRLKKRIDEEKTLRKRFYKHIAESFDKAPALSGIIDPQTAAEYKDQLELVFACLAPLVSDEKRFMWALSTPVPRDIFYSTDAFADFFYREDLKHVEKEASASEKERYQRQRYQYIYSMVLKKFYHLSSNLMEDVMYEYTVPETGLSRYYRIEADTSYIDISYDGELPALNLDAVKRFLHLDDVYKILTDLLPPHRFTFEGFTVVTFSDVTQKYAVEIIKSAIINHTKDRGHQDDTVIKALKTISGDNRVEFGLLPFLKINGRIVFDDEQCSQSILLSCTEQAEGLTEDFNSLLCDFMKKPKPFFFGTFAEQEEELHPVLNVLKSHGVSSYGLLPVFYNNRLSGVLEIYSKEGTIPFEQILSRIEVAIPLLAQILQNYSDEFNAGIEKVIKSKFTSLQPSVQWKFNEAAWNYLKAKKRGNGKAEIGTIAFKQVYPLYGAIDIRDSTIARNEALRGDLSMLLEILIKVLTRVRDLYPLSLTDELIFECRKWLDRISSSITTNDEILLSQFLENQADPFLSHFRENSPESAEIIREYTEASDEATGAAFAGRRNLETSIQEINGAVNAYFEKVQAELQASYPCYFEKFRTDGIEYDIYIGQSIAPDKAFNQLYLRNLRLWQVKSMVEVASLTHSLAETTPVMLHTTQLIFIHSNPIDISFRNDERRFDVEGAYNIRYEIIKKRIDKVAIKESGERLTQPGKIALVYFNYREAEEYVQYVRYLQDQGLLDKDLEFLDLEELQGVTGLKAMRVSVK